MNNIGKVAVLVGALALPQSSEMPSTPYQRAHRDTIVSAVRPGMTKRLVYLSSRYGNSGYLEEQRFDIITRAKDTIANLEREINKHSIEPFLEGQLCYWNHRLDCHFLGKLQRGDTLFAITYKRPESIWESSEYEIPGAFAAGTTKYPHITISQYQTVSAQIDPDGFRLNEPHILNTKETWFRRYVIVADGYPLEELAAQVSDLCKCNVTTDSLINKNPEVRSHTLKPDQLINYETVISR